MINTMRREVRVSPGVTCGILQYALSQKGLIAIVDKIPSSQVSMDGISNLSRRYGLGFDHLVSFDVILPSGKFITVNKSNEYRDLFRAYKGGMLSDIGIVTSYLLQCHPTPIVTKTTWTCERSPSIVEKWMTRVTRSDDNLLDASLVIDNKEVVISMTSSSDYKVEDFSDRKIVVPLLDYLSYSHDPEVHSIHSTTSYYRVKPFSQDELKALFKAVDRAGTRLEIVSLSDASQRIPPSESMLSDRRSISFIVRVSLYDHLMDTETISSVCKAMWMCDRVVSSDVQSYITGVREKYNPSVRP